MDRSWWLEETDRPSQPTAARDVLTKKGRAAIERKRRPAWTVPGEQLLQEARKARAEIRAADRNRWKAEGKRKD